MMRSVHFGRSRLVFSLAAALLLVASACGDDDQVPSGDGGGSTTSTIGAAGGTVALASGAAVTIPAGSLASDLEVTVSEGAEPGVAVPTGFEAASEITAFLPHGSTFSVPVVVTVPYAGTADTVFTLADDSDTSWEAVEDVSLGGGVAEITTSHFSYYVVARTSDPGDDMGTDIGSDMVGGDMGEDMIGGDMGEDTIGGDMGGDTGDVGTDISADLPGEPPSYRQVLATIQGELSSEARIEESDATLIIPATFEVAFKVFVQDDETATEDLLVEVVEGSEPPYTVVTLLENDECDPPSTSCFRSGLWRPVTTISPGQTLRVRTTDGDGHVVYSPGALIVLDLVEAMYDTWEERSYNPEQVIESTNDMTLADDMSWGVDEDGEEGYEFGGTWTLDEDAILTLEVRFSPDTPDGTDVMMSLAAPYYVDETYFLHNPYTREDGVSELEGTWTREENQSMYDEEGTETVVNDYTDTLVINDDDTWTQTWSGTIDGATEETYSRSGTWEIEINENYTESIGDFLVRTVTHENGEELGDSETLFDLFAVRVGNLLVNPRIRKSE